MCCILTAISKIHKLVCLIICLIILIPIIFVAIYFYKWHNSNVDTGFWLVTDNNIAVQERDVVSYYNISKDSVKGVEEFSTNWKNATWYFSTENHLISFNLHPVKYAPRYGGYDSLSMAISGKKKKISPNNWATYKNRLYLFYDHIAQKTWSTNKDGYIISALTHWCKKYENSYDCL